MGVNEELIRLVQENPELPIVPVVYIENCCDDYSSFYGRFDSVDIGRYAEWDGQIYTDVDMFKEDYLLQNKNALYTMCEDDDSVNLCLQRIASSYFKKAILLYIDV
mgnify:FL=1|jgi:hypothetical protein